MSFRILRLTGIVRSGADDEEGAVTVDWVVLSAAIVTLGLIVFSTLRGGLFEAASDIFSSITEGLN